MTPAQSDQAEAADAEAQVGSSAQSADLQFEKSLNDTLGRAMLDDVFNSGRVYADNAKASAHSGLSSAKQQVAPAYVKLLGLSLGENQSHQEVKVKREVGSPEGYDDKLQAVAVARMAHLDPAAVVRIGDKWHAVETIAQMEPTYYDGEDTTRVRNKGDITFEALDKLDRQIQEQGRNAPEELKQQRDDVFGRLQQARQQLAGLLFGVDESDVQFNTRSFNDTPGKINIDPYGKPGDPQGDTHSEGYKDFDSGARPAFGIKLDELENPDETPACSSTKSRTFTTWRWPARGSTITPRKPERSLLMGKSGANRSKSGSTLRQQSIPASLKSRCGAGC